jgi:anti-sigma B factor antagonist
MDLQIDSADGGVAVLRCRGRLNMATASRLTEAIGGCVDGSPRLVVDLTETAFVDSSGLGALISGLKRARQAGGDLRIARPTPAVTAVFSLTNMDKVLRPRDSVEGAFDV